MDAINTIITLIFHAFGLFLQLIISIADIFIVAAQSLLHSLHLG